ncbi:YkgJ family cysteine cluster protein [Psychromonas antarctica]|uniref:YkgJ family cysteine cluster protein n=1 Tax=Psychromonas antarctica TaxID=67573 RepID=UPI001EE81D7A|nr:YkgJ family cysteine cluster protein [Psychromonas antarctica]MCG6202752.1 YkgJ family cysteine cluster protein [Psychromonas antarctica]
MSEHPEVTASKINRTKAIEIIPVKFKQQEEKLLNKVEKSKKNPTAKLIDLYEFMGGLSVSFNHLTPCKKGCSYCCEIRVDVSELELSLIKLKAKKAYNNAKKDLLIGEPCPFLHNGSCSIYEVRPFVCRRHQVFTPTNSLCINNEELGQELLSFSEVDASYLHILNESNCGKSKDIREYFHTGTFKNKKTLCVIHE